MYRFSYDEYGNMIEIRNYGIDEQLKENNNGVAIYRYKYDEKEIILKHN